MGNQQLEFNVDGIPGIDYVVCPICGYTKLRIYRHIINKHHMSIDEFNQSFPNSPTTALAVKQQIQRNTKISLNAEDVVRRRKEFRDSEEGRKMASENGKCAWKNPEWVKYHNQRVSETMKKLWQDEEFHDTQVKKVVESLHTEEVHKKHHDRLVRQWENTTYRNYITSCVEKQFDDGKLGKLKDYIDILGNNVRFRSAWELEVHNILLVLDIEHSYENTKFKKWNPTKNKYLIYCPDFYIPSKDLFLEVKPIKFQNSEINLLKRQMVLDEGRKIVYVGDFEYNSIEAITSILDRF